MASSALRSVPGPPGRLTLLEELSALPTAELRSQLSALLGLTAGNLLRLACIVNVLEDRGEDLVAFKGGFLDILRKIACGQLLPDLVVLFAAEPEKIKRAGALPITDQEDIVAGRRIVPDRKSNRVYRSGGGGSPAPAADSPAAVFRNMGTAGNPRDVGETAAEMILACQSPKDAARFAVDLLRKAGAV